MRSDYGLYGIAIICFIIAGAFMANIVPGYTLAERESGITVTMIFLLIGIISLAVGYSARPKAITPTTQPTPTQAKPPLPEEMPPPSPPPTPPPAEEVTPKPLSPQEPTPTPPIATVPTEPEQPSKVAQEEKPKEKPARRRRKKAQ